MSKAQSRTGRDRAARGGTGLDVDDADPGFIEDPHPQLDALRRRDPVHHDRGRDRMVLTRASDVGEALNDRTLSLDPRKGSAAAAAARGIREGERRDWYMSRLDDPEHARLRGLVSKAFTARAVERMRPRVESIASTLLDAVEAEASFDLIRSLAEPLPLTVLAEMLGIPQERTDEAKACIREITALLAPARDDEELRRWKAANEGLNACFGSMLSDRRLAPRDDLVSALATAEQDGDRLSDDQILDNCRLLLVAGNITTTDLIGNAAVALMRHPAQLDALRADPSSWPAAVEEVLRYDPPVSRHHRQAVGDKEIDGVPVRAGQTITTYLSAANRDPALHADPHRFDVGRRGQRHFSFGGGAHFCLGASLARLEALVALPALFGRFPDLGLAPSRPLRRKRQPGFSGFGEIWVQAGGAPP